MNYLTSSAAKKGVVVFVQNGVQVASFPAKLNGYKIPELEEVEALCGARTEDWYIRFEECVTYCKEQGVSATISCGKVSIIGNGNTCLLSDEDSQDFIKALEKLSVETGYTEQAVTLFLASDYVDCVYPE